ncbi:MAG: 23S rRNA (guanosine(2251)-2'-O)-methyltransferase RlmB [Hespellia sp.]|nr:23S rRNA (guanosine(2251)-2'-O)-methyltransferase RlmB [Hespellia sp.]
MITSTANVKVKELLQLQKKAKLRNQEKVVIVEGLRMFQEIPKEGLKRVYFSESFYNRKKEELKLEQYSYELLSDTVFAYVSDTKTPQGVLCIVSQPEYQLKAVIEASQPHILVLDNLQDPGNLGTILRTAEGAGVTGIIMSRDCVDIFNPKVIRSTMGSIYRIPFLYVDDLVQAITQMKKQGIRTFAAHLQGENNYDEADYRRACAFLIGNEGNGLRGEIAEQADEWIQIPMQGQVESLNAAIAASILMFEAARQRRRQ